MCHNFSRYANMLRHFMDSIVGNSNEINISVFSYHRPIISRLGFELVGKFARCSGIAAKYLHDPMSGLS